MSEGSGEERTTIAPGPDARSWPEPSAPPLGAVPPSAPGRVEIGAVLNNIYLVKRFIARGGMGEVYEGENVNTEERVAIKVMLPTLAADPNVQAMFRKEAKTLTRLAHPAVVQYRVLAQEPQLGVFYIVTEFIEGAPLSERLRGLNPTAEELRALLRRLAEGLGAAHDLGAVHRDLSPDNILLQDDRLERAKIIDFGIAKDLDPAKGTLVGEGFAGKLTFVAPEQFGDYGREIGPWTDIYSLGLVILAAASGGIVDMGSTLVEAVDKRRKGPDLSAIPDELRPVLERMLRPDPAERFRSTGELLAALGGPEAASAPAPAGGMNVASAEERVLVLADRLNMEQAEMRAWIKRLEAFGTLAKVAGFLSRPKDEEFELLYREKRLQPFWRVVCVAASAYERTREYVVRVAPEVQSVRVAGETLATPAQQFAISGLETCREEARKDVIYDGLTKEPAPALASYLSCEHAAATRAALAAFAQDGVVVVPPQLKASTAVREVLASAITKIEADRVLDESVRFEAVDLYYRPVYAFRYRRQNKEAVIEVDGVTGEARAGGKTFEHYLGKILEPNFLFDVTLETANLFIPGAKLANVLIQGSIRAAREIKETKSR